jgi:hypothetical protein
MDVCEPHLRAHGCETFIAEDELPGTVEGFSLSFWTKLNPTNY